MPRVIAAVAMLLLPQGVLAQPRGNTDPAQQVTAPPARPPAPRVQAPIEAGAGASDFAELGLARQDDGSYLYVDPSARFTARLHPDGTVSFADRWKRPSDGDRQNGTCCALPADGLSAISPFFGVPMSGPLEWFLKAYGYDLNTGAKTSLLERTRELRTRMAVAWHLRQLEKRLRELEPELLHAWTDRQRSLQARKDYLFQRWDECDEHFAVDPGEIPPDAILKIDEARMATAEDARRRIEAFVRRHLRKGSREAFSAAELRERNRRRVSKQAFEPYRVRDSASR